MLKHRQLNFLFWLPLYRNLHLFLFSQSPIDGTSIISLHQTGQSKDSSFFIHMLGDSKRGQATSDYDSTAKDELSLMIYEVTTHLNA